jgi:FlaA1/EpsC-like NDP-sugar epimerase
MTRFMMTLDDAVDLVLYAFEHGQPGEIFVQKAPAATIGVLAKALTALVGKPEQEPRWILLKMSYSAKTLLQGTIIFQPRNSNFV